MIIHSIAKIGLGKEQCDDSILINNEIINNDVLNIDCNELKKICIADGVGGFPGGKDASLFMMDFVAKQNFSNMSVEEVRAAFIHANDRLIETAKNITGKEKMATTFTGLVKARNAIVLIHIGNTRLYVGQGNYLKQITEDQTTVQWLRNIGEFEASSKANKNEILGCFGGGNTSLCSYLEVKEIFNNELPKIIVLTSDGVHEYIDIDTLEDLILNDDSSPVAIINHCLENKSADDKSIIIIK